MTLAMSIYLTKNWIQTRQHQQLLETEKLETELKFLRHQFNPHFLFNTINSIFFLIHKNPNQASASLANFSELLRYQLYECNDPQIPLNKGIAYLENFIDLKKLRQNRNVTVTMAIETVYTPQVAIAPFILMPFVENAFKHVSKYSDRPNWITIHLQVEGAYLRFVVANSFALDTTYEFIHYGGIGLSNVQRRLDLLYPARYQLRIQPEVDQFRITLEIGLDDLVLSPVKQFA